MKLSVLIPSKNELYLEKTRQDVLSRARGDVEVLVYEDKGIGNGLRHGINEMVKKATGDYLLKLDAHCMLDGGFDLKLIEAHHPNWVQIPRRKRLDAERWMVIEDGREPVDYEHLVFRNLVSSEGQLSSKGFIWGTPWDTLTRDRKDILIDNTPHFQGSCWFMSKEWFQECSFMDLLYGGFAQESEEILFTTLKRGGEVKVNKNTWYAHLHKNKEAREWFRLDSEDMKTGYTHSYNLWVDKNRELFEKYINSFPLMPDWPLNWKQILWSN